MAINKKYVLCCCLILALSYPIPKDGTISVYSLPSVTFRRTACRTAKEDKIQPGNLLSEGTDTHTNPKLWFKITQKAQPCSPHIWPTNT